MAKLNIFGKSIFSRLLSMRSHRAKKPSWTEGLTETGNGGTPDFPEGSIQDSSMRGEPPNLGSQGTKIGSENEFP
jgi:hypothetical protein